MKLWILWRSLTFVGLLGLLLWLTLWNGWLAPTHNTEADLLSTVSGGTPYGPTHVSGSDSNRPLSEEEKRLCFALGKRLAQLAQQL